MNPPHVAVVGGGQMGAGIAQSFLTAGSAVTVVETADPDAARDRIAQGLESAAARGKLTGGVSDALARLTVLPGIPACPPTPPSS